MQSVTTTFLPSGAGFGTAVTNAIITENAFTGGKRPVRVYDVIVNANKTGELLILKTGPTTNSGAYFTVITETIATVATACTELVFGEGFIFPNGLYVTSGSGFVSMMISYLVEV